MASTWTDEENIKFQVAYMEAFESETFAIDTTQFWDYIVKAVGSGKTVQDCKGKLEAFIQDYEAGKIDEPERFPPVKNEKSEEVKDEKKEEVKKEKSENVKNEKSEDKK